MSTNSGSIIEAGEAPARLGSRITRLFRLWRREVEAQLVDLDMTGAVGGPLVVLYDHGGTMHQKDIAAEMALDTSSLVRVLKLLSERGLIECRPDESDRRAKCIGLTDQGRDMARRIIGRSLAIEAEALSIFDERERAVLGAALDRLSEHLSQHTSGASRPV